MNRTDLSGKTTSECIFKEIFEDAIGSSRTHSKRTIKSLLIMFSNHDHLGKKWQTKDVKENKVPILSYISEILAYLPFNHLGDVLFIIHSISETIALEGNEITRKMAAFLQSNGISDTDPDPSYFDVLEKAATKKQPCRTKALAAVNKKGFNLKRFAELCTESCSLTLLVRLYFYLREGYKGVTDKRLVEYDPSEKERINERGVSKGTNVPPFDSQIPLSYSNKGAIDKDNLIRQYALFRNNMRNYDRSFSIQSEDSEQDDNKDNSEDSTDTRKRKLTDITSA